MAKPKVKLDTVKIKQFFIQHGEKLVMGLCFVCFLLLVYGTLGLERMDRTPPDLLRSVQQAQQKLTDSKLDINASGIVVRDYSDKAKEVTNDVLLAGYDWLPVNPPIWPPGDKRSRPQFFALESIQVNTGVAAFDLKPESVAQSTPPAEANAPAKPNPAPAKEGGSSMTLTFGAKAAPANAGAPGRGSGRNAQGLRYAVVLGLVPYERQTKEYLETFRGVSNPRPETDSAPSYRAIGDGLAAWVKRAELKPGVPDEQLQWVFIDNPQDPDNPKTNNRRFKSRYNGTQPELADAAVVDPLLTEPLPPLANIDWDASTVVHEQVPLAPKREGLAPTATPATPTNPLTPPGALPPGMEAPAAEPPADDTKPPAEAEEPTADPQQTPYLLFRYFDFTAEPGKTYRYSVLLALENPNYEIEPQFLVDPKIGENAVVYSDASPSSPPATIPFDGSLYAGDLMPGNASTEIAAKLAVEQWLPDGGLAVQVIDRVFRGHLVNFKLDEVVLVSLGGSPPKKSEKGKEYPVRTELTVVDMMGDQESSGKKANLLIMDSTGGLTVRKSASDRAHFDQIAQNVKEATDVKKQDKEKRDSNDALSGRGRKAAAGQTPTSTTGADKSRRKRAGDADANQ